MPKGYCKIALMLPLLSLAVNAGEIKGVVRDSRTKEPVIGASIFVRSPLLPPEGLIVLTEDGDYRFPDLKAGTYVVTADFSGVKDEKTVTITDSQTVNVALSMNLSRAAAATYKIEATGTRLPTAYAAAVSPVATLDETDIKTQGSTRIEDVVNSLPQAFASQGSTVSNGSDGTAQVNLRNLGSARSLILIDGRRLGPGNPNTFAPAVGDLNFIPAALVERVDVLTGGASAVYGADAVAGVVNFVMKKNFEGVQLDLGWDFYQHTQQNKELQALVAGRGATNPTQFQVPPNNLHLMGPSGSLLVGVNSPDGKGNVTAYGAYRLDLGILQKDFDYSACGLNSGDTFTCGGSSTTSPPAFADDNGKFVVTSPTGFADFTNDNRYNFNPLNYFQRPDERWNLGAFAHYKLASFADVYTQGMFLNDASNAQIAPGGIFYGDPITVNCGNPLLQANAALYDELCGPGGGLFGPGNTGGPNDNAGGPDGILIGKRNVESNGRQAIFNHSEYRYVFGLKGDLAPNWNYDVYHQYMASDVLDIEDNYFNKERVSRAFHVVNSPVTGLPVCTSTLLDPTDPNYDPDCVPYDIFTNGNVTPEALKYLQVPGIRAARSTERVVSGNIAGNLGTYGIRSPFACDGVAVAVGGEYRGQTLRNYTDSALASGQLEGQGGNSPGISTYFTVAEGFAEIRIPLVQNLIAMKTLQVEGAYRYSNYNFADTQIKDTHTYKVGGIWEFVDNMRIRGSYQRAVRAPSLAELFAPPTVGLDGGTDPCALQGSGLAPNDPAVLACVAAFPTLTANDILNIAPSPASQYNGQFGGRPTLKPELSDTIAVGVFLQPSFIPGLQVSADYFNIKIDQIITIVGADFTLSQCLADPTSIAPSGQTYCSLVHRDPTNNPLRRGSLWLSPNGYVVDLNQNLGFTRTDGVDFFVGYDMDTKSMFGSNWGRVYFAMNGTWLHQLTTQPLAGPNQPSYNCTGLHGNVCGTPSPEWRHKIRATWDTPINLSLSAQYRFISSVGLDVNDPQPALFSAGSPATDLRLGARHYLDVFASYAIDVFTFRFGVNNVIDQDPPLVGSSNNPIGGGGNGNTIPQVYDSLGRYFFMNLTAKF
jgi:iron complex outermembrane receptor protein